MLVLELYNLRPSPVSCRHDGMLDVYTKKAFRGRHRSLIFVQPVVGAWEIKERNGHRLRRNQRTSVLATNRMVARVDPRATAGCPLVRANLIQRLAGIAQIHSHHNQLEFWADKPVEVLIRQ